MKQALPHLSRSVPASPQAVPAYVGSWIVVVADSGSERALGRVINATAAAAQATAVAFFEWIVPEGARLGVIPEPDASAALRFEANCATLLPVLESLNP
jgi:hypothetical protein